MTFPPWGKPTKQKLSQCMGQCLGKVEGTEHQLKKKRGGLHEIEEITAKT